MARTRRTFTSEFKLQMVRLFENGKSKSDIAREYDLTRSALDKWIKNHQNSCSFNVVDNLTDEEKLLLVLLTQIERAFVQDELKMS